MTRQQPNEKPTYNANKADLKNSYLSEHFEELDPPPPSFPESQAQSLARNDQFNGPNSSSSASAYPMQPHHTPVPAFTMNTKYTNLAGSRMSVTSADSNPLYNVHCKLINCTMEFTNSSNHDSRVATAAFHALTSRIDTTINDHAIPMKSGGGMLKWEYSFTSAAQGAKLTWRCNRSTHEMLLTDEEGIQIARFRYPRLNYSKEGRLEVFARERVSGQPLDEIVVTALAFGHLILWVNFASWGVATVGN